MQKVSAVAEKPKLLSLGTGLRWPRAQFKLGPAPRRHFVALQHMQLLNFAIFCILSTKNKLQPYLDFASAAGDAPASPEPLHGHCSNNIVENRGPNLML